VLADVSIDGAVLAVSLIQFKFASSWCDSIRQVSNLGTNWATQFPEVNVVIFAVLFQKLRSHCIRVMAWSL